MHGASGSGARHRASYAYSTSSFEASGVLKLRLYTGPQCSLCDDVKEVIDSARKEAPAFTLELFNIRDDSLSDVHKWRRLYQYDIPVLHLNGEEIARHSLDKGKFIAALQAHQKVAKSGGQD
ncbi:DUF836-domain-containing protein [Tilletiaria anomala UBC 951]|uniref:Glutaredoxin-like protein n=1 Tax=Tilletiaria anomala (strain ATCC 24038 / CBS 436.72 / UBC 951) TaxID=1037660 RepID=A0A066VCJ4_TILAU|nr:DUF836-domain-containing protein [Tilletiaria anomala UBC 951]KDN36484.1 DUF836-domain-containing protein [Tilletiaria anomala UBC 951]